MGPKEEKVGALDNKLYILHGWTTDTTRWNPFLLSLSKAGVDPIFLNIPGLTAQIDRPWTLSDYVEWLSKTLPQSKKVRLLGHSNGGRISLAFAHSYPERVEQLFLIDSAGIYHNDFFSITKREVFRIISKVGKKITSSRKAKDLLYQVAQESDYKNATPAMKQTMKNLISYDLTPLLKEIKAPTTIIWGKNDAITPFTDALVFKNELSNCTLFPIENAFHSPQFTHASQVIEIIKKEFK